MFLKSLGKDNKIIYICFNKVLHILEHIVSILLDICYAILKTYSINIKNFSTIISINYKLILVFLLDIKLVEERKSIYYCNILGSL